MSERLISVFNSPLGKLLMGIIKLALAGFLLSLINTLQNLGGDVTIGDVTIPITTIVKLLIAFFPILLLISAFRDLGIRI
jgi:hypothetical protein